MTAEDLERSVNKIVAELRDWGSERRHRQLLSICDQHNLRSLSEQALFATRDRLARERKLGVLENPGAYYQKTLIKRLADHGVFVPKAGEAVEVRADLGLPKDATLEELRAAIRASLPPVHADEDTRIWPQEAR